MSEPAPEPRTRPGQPAGGKPKGKENVFTRKIGPLPMWVWLAIIAAAIVVWALWSGHKKSSTSGSGTGKGTGHGGRGGFGSSLVPPEVVHVYNRRRRGRDDEDEDEDERQGDRDDKHYGPRR